MKLNYKQHQTINIKFKTVNIKETESKGFGKSIWCPYPTFLLTGQLLGLLPHLCGVQEVGGDLHVAGGHLMDALRDGDGGAAALARGTAGGVTACAAWRHFRWHRGRHTDRFTEGQEEEEVRYSLTDVLAVIWSVCGHLFWKQEVTLC